MAVPQTIPSSYSLLEKYLSRLTLLLKRHFLGFKFLFTCTYIDTQLGTVLNWSKTIEIFQHIWFILRLIFLFYCIADSNILRVYTNNILHELHILHLFEKC